MVPPLSVEGPHWTSRCNIGPLASLVSSNFLITASDIGSYVGSGRTPKELRFSKSNSEQSNYYAAGEASNPSIPFLSAVVALQRWLRTDG